jgi:HNH endonuclease
MGNIPYGYCQCGCDAKTELSPKNITRNGWRKGEPKRYIHGHNRRGLRNADRDRYTIIDMGYETPCWVWDGPLVNNGYAQINVEGRLVMAHRYHYEKRFGPIPDGKQLDHLCCVRHCVNPEHLEPVTGTENVRRGRRTNLTPADVRTIRALHATGDHSQGAIGRLYGLTPHAIRRIVKRQTWKDVT